MINFSEKSTIELHYFVVYSKVNARSRWIFDNLSDAVKVTTLFQPRHHNEAKAVSFNKAIKLIETRFFIQIFNSNDHFLSFVTRILRSLSPYQESWLEILCVLECFRVSVLLLTDVICVDCEFTPVQLADRLIGDFRRPRSCVIFLRSSEPLLCPKYWPWYIIGSTSWFFVEILLKLDADWGKSLWAEQLPVVVVNDKFWYIGFATPL